MQQTKTLSPDDTKRLGEFAEDLLAALDVASAPAILTALDEAMKTVPQTTEEVGFYVGQNHNAFENCFRFLISRLHSTDAVMTAEDKYSHEMFAAFEARGVRSPKAHALFPMFFGEMDEAAIEEKGEETLQAELVEDLKNGYAEMTSEIEGGFANANKRLLSLWTIPGDTTYFVAVPHAFAETWANVVVGRAHDGQQMGVRDPAWGAFYNFLCYTLMLPDHPAPRGATDPAWAP